MRLKRGLLFLSVIAFQCPFLLSIEVRLLIQVHLFYTTQAQSPADFDQTKIQSTSSRIELVPLKEAASSSEKEFTASIVNGLLELYDLDSIEDLFLHESPWNGNGRPDLRGAYFYKNIFYRVSIQPHRLPSGQIALHLSIHKSSQPGSKSAEEDEVVIDQELLLSVEEPIIIGVRRKEGIYFLMVRITRGNPRTTLPETERPLRARQIDQAVVPEALVRVRPDFPEALQNRNIAGEIGVRLTIDANGDVIRVDVVKPLYPYLNYTAVQAFLQWKFEPVLDKGRPIPVIFDYTYDFNREMDVGLSTMGSMPKMGSNPPSQGDLPDVLAGVGEYCSRLNRVALDFVCDETIKETHFDLLNGPRLVTVVVGPKAEVVAQENHPLFEDNEQDDSRPRYVPGKVRIVDWWIVMDPKKTRRNTFLCDYQIVKKAAILAERRYLLRANGHRVKEQKLPFMENRFSGLSSLFAPLRVMAKEVQSKFDYSVIGKERVLERMARVIAALPKSGDENGIWSAKIWVDEKNFRVLKCEIEGVPIDGYEDVLNDCVALNIRPKFITSHRYRNERSGVLLPWQSDVRVEYGIESLGLVPKNMISLKYDHYKFFLVETNHTIDKSNR